ncbi:hypothetical protein ACJ6WF_21865 [Streptomyces sp. MMS24-I2-30]|uniref:hypothetical protein n=1 Tax=Streptomyces sp. MMS24-I2-30 TaxID=3351564 RepID=UPI003896D4A9
MDQAFKKVYLELEDGGLKSDSTRLRTALAAGGSAAQGAMGEVGSLVMDARQRKADLDRRAASMGAPKEAPEKVSAEAIHQRVADKIEKLYEKSKAESDGALMIDHVLAWATIKKAQHNLMQKRLDDVSEQTRAARYAPMYQAVETMQGVAAWFSGQARNPVGGAARGTQPPVTSAAATRGRPQLAGSTAGLPYRPADKPKGPTR